MRNLALIGRRLGRHLRGATGRSGAGDWGSYLAGIEPALTLRPRVVSFAQVPAVLGPQAPAAPLAVWIDGDGEAAQRTRDSLTDGGGLAPAAVLAGSLSEALSQTTCERVVLLRAGDVLAPEALRILGQAAAQVPEAEVITCDEDRLDAAGTRHAPVFRPGPSPERWLAWDDSGELLVVARESAARRLGSLADPFPKHVLALSLAGRDARGHAHVPLLLCHRPDGLGDEPAAGPERVAQLLRGRDGAEVTVEGEGVRRVHRPTALEPSVEVIVCLRDRPELLRRCVGSLRSGTDYEHLGLTLVDNGSREPETLELLATLAKDPRVRVLHDSRPFNFARLNNAAARQTEADLLVFLNNDTETIDRDWITTLSEEASRPEIGAVAPLLLYPDATVQHAGAALGLHGYAGHPFAGLARDTVTPFGRPSQGTRNWLAVTAACLMVGRSKFAQVGGFDESFIVAGNDVDLCLRLTRAGYRSLCVPHASLIHDESRSRGGHIDPGDFLRSAQTYGEFRTVGDPFYSPSLTLQRTDCSIRTLREGAPQ